MSDRIRDIFDAIHRPLANGRRVMALSRAEAERVPLLPGVAMISITAPGSVPAKIPEYEFLLRQSFSDVDFLSADLSSRAASKFQNAMSKEQAMRILSFVNSLPDSIHTLLVHCEGGFSRSCGVSAALGTIFRYEVEEKRLTDANQSVKKRLMEVAAVSAGRRHSR